MSVQRITSHSPAVCLPLPPQDPPQGDDPREVSPLPCAERTLGVSSPTEKAADLLIDGVLSQLLVSSMIAGDSATLTGILASGHIFSAEKLAGIIALAYIFERDEIASLLIDHCPALTLLAQARAGNAAECSRLLEEWRSQEELFTPNNLQWCFVCAALGSNEEIMEQLFYLFLSADVTFAMMGPASTNDIRWVERLLEGRSDDDCNIAGALMYALLRESNAVAEQLLQTPLMQHNRESWSELLSIPQFLEVAILRNNLHFPSQLLSKLQRYNLLSNVDLISAAEVGSR